MQTGFASFSRPAAVIEQPCPVRMARAEVDPSDQLSTIGEADGPGGAAVFAPIMRAGSDALVEIEPTQRSGWIAQREDLAVDEAGGVLARDQTRVAAEVVKTAGGGRSA